MTPKRIAEAIERCAAAAYDTMYDVTAKDSMDGFAFETDSRVRQTWRDIAMAVLRAAGDFE